MHRVSQLPYCQARSQKGKPMLLDLPLSRILVVSLVSAAMSVKPSPCDAKQDTNQHLPEQNLQTANASGMQVDDALRENRLRFQNQELMPSRSGGWFLQPGGPAPRIIWRDADAVREAGLDTPFRTRWFDAELKEAEKPDHAGRWMAWIEGVAPNGTPMRRSFTFYAIPQKPDLGFIPDLTVRLPNFPGSNAPQAIIEHQREFDAAAKDFFTKGLMESERGAILVAGLTESRRLGRPKQFVETTGAVNEAFHLALKLKVLGLQDKVRPLQPPRVNEQLAPVLREGSSAEAGVPEGAKAKIDAFCREWNAATREPFVILVAKDGVIITHEAFGNGPDGQPITTDYRCWIASLTKTVTSLMFLQFIDQGLIDPDAPLSSVFPDYPVDSSHVPTFRQCLNHTAGLAVTGEFGGMANPHLENVILNGIDIIEPGKAHQYTGTGFELVAKAMELVTGKTAVRVFHDHLFEPLGFGDVVLGNASSAGEFTARELAILGQWMVNRGSYGDRQFVSSDTFEELMPKPLGVPGAFEDYGMGIHWIRHLKPGAPTGSKNPEDWLFGPRAVGHGSFSGCILNVDPDQKLVIAQVRRQFAGSDNVWWTRFFQSIAEATNPE
jgi:CubicO group peptidase (beta-lactamase class C family)